MTGPGVQFRTDSEVIHYEHQALSSELAALEFALDSLIGCSEVFTNFASTERVYRCTRHLAHSLPEHFQNEENTVLAEVAGISPELGKFAEEMKKQHRELREKLTAFYLLIDQLATSEEIEQAVSEVKEQGRELTRALAA